MRNGCHLAPFSLPARFDGFGDAGASSATHTHPPSVLVSLAKARFRVTINGKTRIFDFEPASAGAIISNTPGNR